MPQDRPIDPGQRYGPKPVQHNSNMMQGNGRQYGANPTATNPHSRRPGTDEYTNNQGRPYRAPYQANEQAYGQNSSLQQQWQQPRMHFSPEGNDNNNRYARNDIGRHEQPQSRQDNAMIYGNAPTNSNGRNYGRSSPNYQYPHSSHSQPKVAQSTSST